MKKIISIIFNYVFVIGLFSQTFTDFQITKGQLDYGLNTDKSFAISANNELHLIYHSYGETSQILFYSIIDTTTNQLLFKTPVDTFDQSSLIVSFVHHYSIHFGSNDSLYVFYYKETVEHNENSDILSINNQVVYRKIKNNYVSPELILYETSLPILNIEFSLDSKLDYHGVILTEMNDWPESPKKIIYVNHDTVFAIDSNIVEAEIQNFCMDIDSNNSLHCFITNYSGLENKYYINHWKMKSGNIFRDKIDSITGPEIEIWYRALKVIKNINQELFLISLKDSINIYCINDNSIINVRTIPYVDESIATVLYSVTIIDSLIHAIAWNYELFSKYIIVSPYHLDQEPVYASIKHAAIGLKLNNNGYVYGIHRSEINDINELSILKSKLPLDPLPILPPLKPNLECNDTSLCEGEDKKIIYSGIEIKWYDNESLINVGDSLDLSSFKHGKHTIRLSENMLDFESLKDTLFVEVYPNPANFLRTDTTIQNDNSLLITVDSTFLAYYWDGIEGSNSYTFDAKDYTIGNYKIELTVVDTNNCSGIDSMNVTVIEPTQIPDNHDSYYIFYPNPTKSSVTVCVDNIIDKILLVDDTGKILKIFQINSDKITIDLNEFYTGVYFINLITNAGRIIQEKIIKL